MGMFSPLSCMTSGEQFGEEIEAEHSSKDNFATTMWKRPLVMTGMESLGGGNVVASDSLNPLPSLWILQSFRKDIDAQNDVKKILSTLYEQL